MIAQLASCCACVSLLLMLMVGCKDQGTVPPPSVQRLDLSSFTSAQVCSTCHPVHYEEWAGSMHRYATNDPIWMLANNSLQQSTSGRLNDWCWQCHSPIAFLTGNTRQSFRIEDLPAIVREGVSCDVCHSLRPPHTTTNQRIQYTITPGKTKYGSIADPVPSAFHESAYDPSFSRSEKCRECHDLIVNNIPVEITFTEWQNSAWGAMSVECQQCHMRTYTGRAAVGGPIRDNLHRHDFVGVDVAMTDFPNKAVQRAMVDSLLKNSACMTLSAPSTARRGDTIEVHVTVCNDRTGHNLPSSVFFNRQMWVELTVARDQDTAYKSGYLDANGDLMDRHSALQPNADRDLMLFSGLLFKNGRETSVFEVDSVVNTSLAPFAARTGRYRFRVPSAGIWNVRARLLFRPFGPYLFRSLGAGQYLSEIPTFEMKSDETIINVQ
jgi:hypothetical protein